MIERPTTKRRRKDTQVATLATQLRMLTRAVTAAQRSAAGVRHAPDAIAMFYDLARLDEALGEVREAASALEQLVRFPN